MSVLRKLGYRLYRVYLAVARPITVGVRAVLVREGQVLLVRHTYQDHWYLPGGGVKKGETLTEAIITALRERLQREAGRARVKRLCEELRRIGERCAALPVHDGRTPEQIIGYDDRGLPG